MGKKGHGRLMGNLKIQRTFALEGRSLRVDRIMWDHRVAEGKVNLQNEKRRRTE